MIVIHQDELKNESNIELYLIQNYSTHDFLVYENNIYLYPSKDSKNINTYNYKINKYSKNRKNIK